MGDAMLVLVGPDSEGFRNQVELMVRQHALEDRVLLTGMLTGRDRIEALADATLFSLPSYHENFGMSVIEALAAGLPVIISDHVYLHQEVALARVGAVVPLNIDALAAELARWMADKELRAAAAARARTFVREKYDWRQIAGHWVGHYEGLGS
jgi:glycosyltransferase involved in cell wall biosynthesis